MMQCEEQLHQDRYYLDLKDGAAGSYIYLQALRLFRRKSPAQPTHPRSIFSFNRERKCPIFKQCSCDRCNPRSCDSTLYNSKYVLHLRTSSLHRPHRCASSSASYMCVAPI